MYRIPIYKIMMVKDSNHIAEVKHVKSPIDAYAILNGYMAGLDRENFVVLMLDTKNKVIGINTVSVGTLSASLVHPREVFKPAIISNAAGIILAHNHPSGDPAPSREDIEISKRLSDAGKLLDIKVLDHVIISDGNYASLREKNLLS